MAVSHAVVVITYRRPDHLRACLEALARLSRSPERVLVVDQSPDDASKAVVARFRGVEWIDNRANAGRMTSSRNVGLELVVGDCDVVSFVDDDSLVSVEWADEVLAAFDRHPEAGGVGGRVDNGNPAEESDPGPVGWIDRNGQVVGNFGVRRDGDLVVDHVVGANMSFRTDVLADLGGFREDYPGTAMGEDTDVCLRVTRSGRLIIFASQAVVRHTSAPHVRGRRFGWRYAFFAAANFVLLMRRNFGAWSSQTRGQVRAPWRVWQEDRSIQGRALRFAIGNAGVCAGVVLTVRRDGLAKSPLRLEDERARRIRAAHAAGLLQR